MTQAVTQPWALAASNEADRRFLAAMAEGAQMHAELGRLAAGKADSAAARRFGQRMAEYWMSAEARIRALAEARGIALPAGVNSKHRGTIAAFRDMEGPAFERAYALVVTRTYRDGLPLAKSAAQDCSDGELRSFASRLARDMQGHLRTAGKTLTTEGQ